MSVWEFSSGPDADTRCPPTSLSLRVSTGRDLPSLHPPTTAARAASSPHQSCGGKGNLFPRNLHVPKSSYCAAENPHPHLCQRQPGLNPASAATPRPRIFLPPHFCLKAFSVCEWLSTAFLSNSSQRGGRSSCKPELRGTVAGRGCGKGHRGPGSCQPPAACMRKSSIGHKAV